MLPLGSKQHLRPRGYFYLGNNRKKKYINYRDAAKSQVNELPWKQMYDVTANTNTDNNATDVESQWMRWSYRQCVFFGPGELV